MRQIILDTETTGLDPVQGHRIVEIACVEMVNRALTGNHLHLYVNPGRDSDPEALNIHGLTTEFLSGHPRFESVADQIVEFLEGSEVIIHNAAFDKKFLNAEFARTGHSTLDKMCDKITDSLLYARELHPGKRNSLDALCERYGISNAHRTLHGALLDSELLADVWLAMTRGQDALIMDFEEADAKNGTGIRLEKFDASVLQVLHATAAEADAHDAYLGALDKASGKPCVWRGAAPAGE